MVRVERADNMITSGIDKEGESLRLLVAQALCAYPTASLLPFLEDKSVLVRSAAAREIQNRGDQKSFEHAVALLGDKRAFVREIGVFILGQHGTPTYPYKAQTIPLVAERLALDKSAAVRAAAAAALGHLSAYEALEFLITAATDNSIEVRACVAFALTRMKRRGKAREVLRILKNDQNEEVRFWAND
jgi:HEAT repeat protein